MLANGKIPIGVKGYAKSPSNRAVCGICRKTIEKGHWRADYRFQESRQLSHMKRIHLVCMDKLPAEGRPECLRILNAFLGQPGLADDAREALTAARDSIAAG